MSWPRVLGSKPSLKDINLLSWLLLATIAAPLFIAHSGGEQIRVADFVQLYSVGRILNEYPAQDLYNYQLQQKLSHELHPLKEGFYGPSPYPPFVAILLRPFARMPYLGAYILWMLISLVLYLAGLAIVTRRFFRTDPLRRLLVFCFALGFYPFIVGTMINGQLAAIAFFSLALAIQEDDRARPFLSGLALSL
ncbi:MAG: glycosyltransferase family 87 protein, partial [Bryobacteraceae bacterium]